MNPRWLDFVVRHRPRRSDHLFAASFTPMGHRGAAGLAPENTLAAIRAALELGVDFEIDVSLCASGEVVVMHDEVVDRTTEGTGTIEAMSLDALKALHIEGAHRIPTLAEVLQLARGRALVNIELKTTQHKARLMRAVLRAVRAYSAEDAVIFTSFDPYLLEEAKKQAPAVLRGQIYSRFDDTDLAQYKRVVLRNLLLNQRAQPDLLMVEQSLVDGAYLERAHGLGYRVFAWTVNEVQDMKHLIDLGVDGIISDRPDRLRSIDGLNENSRLEPYFKTPGSP